MGSTGKSIAKFFKYKEFNIFFWDDNEKKLDNVKAPFYKYSNEGLSKFNCIYVSPGINKNHRIIKKALEKNIRVSSDIDLFLEYTQKLKTKNKILAITGTNGKSSIALMIAKALNLKPLANFGNLVLENFPKKNEEIILELSSYQLEYITFIKPKISIISNVKEDHLSYHGSFNNYFLSKTKISKYQNKNDYLILNRDDPNLYTHYNGNSNRNVQIIWVSSKNKIERGIYFIDNKLVDNFFNNSEHIISKNTTLEKNHNKLNFAISYAALMSLGLKSKAIIKSLVKFKGLPHRMEHIGDLNDIDFYNDSKATNVSATCAALENFKKVFLIAGGSKKGGNFNKLADFSENVYEAYLVGETALDIKKVLERYCKIFICSNLEDAVKKSYMKSLNTKKKYPILLSPACASFDRYENFESRGMHFKNIFYKLSSGNYNE